MGLAIVTGGSRGIGAAIAEKLAQDGHDVLINCASSVEKAEAVAEKCRAYGVKAYVKQWDVADYDACAAALSLKRQLRTSPSRKSRRLPQVRSARRFRKATTRTARSSAARLPVCSRSCIRAKRS